METKWKVTYYKQGKKFETTLLGDESVRLFKEVARENSWRIWSIES
jgi:hypothetical protein